MQKAHDLLMFLVSHLVEDVDSINLEHEEEEGILRFNLTVAQDDMKYVIGRRGKTIRSLQSALRVLGAKQQQRIFLNLIDNK